MSADLFEDAIAGRQEETCGARSRRVKNRYRAGDQSQETGNSCSEEFGEKVIEAMQGKIKAMVTEELESPVGATF